ncbi:MAG: hypothetical protein M1834_009376 [Cirrosporium novae-zelandiae]|nr:MAG: hypothetical protein M1834_009376 [Cirrosporium novae-zelandiae]
MSMSSDECSGPLANLSLSDPQCWNDSCCAFYEAHMESQKQVSYYHQFDYGHWTLWYYAIWLFLAMLTYAYHVWDDHKPVSPRPSTTQTKSHVSIYQKTLGFTRWLSYRRLRGPLNDRLGLPALGIHEKLNVIHRWVAWMYFGLAWVHTTPFLIAPVRDGGLARLHYQFYKSGSFEYTGIRHRLYELFYQFHFLLAVVYLGLMFWHAGQEQDSWAYLWATLAIWLVQILMRVFHKNQSLRLRDQWMLDGCPTYLKALPGDMTRIEIIAPGHLKWRPGQHVFLRFMNLSIWNNHPFTIASVPDTTNSISPEESEKQQAQSLVFYVRTHKGFTKKLSTFVSSNVDISTTAWIDGPYGGTPRRIENSFDTAIFVAGGAGITACIPWLLHLSQHMHSGNHNVRITKIKLVWAIRREEHLTWIGEEMKRIWNMARKGDFEVQIYITREGGEDSDTAKKVATVSNKELSPADTPSTPTSKEHDICPVSPTSPKRGGTHASTEDISYHHLYQGRPKVSDVMPLLITPGKNYILGCGPESMSVDLSNAVAAAQLKVLKEEVEEIALWTESFGM